MTTCATSRASAPWTSCPIPPPPEHRSAPAGCCRSFLPSARRMARRGPQPCRHHRGKAATVFRESQLLTYMKLAGIRIGLLMNFNVARLKDGIKRFVL